MKKFKINPAELKHPIVITATTKDKIDNIPVIGTQELLRTRAKIINITGFQYFKQLEINSKIVKTFYIRYPRKCKISKEHQIIYDGRKYNIVYANNIDEASRYLELKCEEVS